MPKKVELWEGEDKQIYDTEEEAREGETLAKLLEVSRISEDELNTVIYLLEDEEQVKLLRDHMNARKAVKRMREKK